MRGCVTQAVRALWIGTCCLLASGCMPHATIWNYLVESYQPTSQPLTQKRLVVPPFKDSRPTTNEDAGALIYIPLMPYGWLDYALPEGAFAFAVELVPVHQFRPKDDLARAAADELRASGIFKEVNAAPRAIEGDLVLHGEIKSTRYYAILLSYGLSIAAGFPWLIGLPAGKVINELVVEFSFEDSGTSTVLWRKRYEEKYQATIWMPYSLPRQFDYAAMYKTMLRDVVQNLRQELTSRP